QFATTEQLLCDVAHFLSKSNRTFAEPSCSLVLTPDSIDPSQTGRTLPLSTATTVRMSCAQAGIDFFVSRRPVAFPKRKHRHRIAYLGGVSPRLAHITGKAQCVREAHLQGGAQLRLRGARLQELPAVPCLGLALCANRGVNVTAH